MSNTHILKIAAFVSLHLGIVMAFSGEVDYVKASLTSQGSLVTERIAESAILKGAAPAFLPLYEKAAASQEVVVGVLLILLGFFFHAFYKIRSPHPVRIEEEKESDDRAVTVHQAPRMQRKEQKVFWMEMRI